MKWDSVQEGLEMQNAAMREEMQGLNSPSVTGILGRRKPAFHAMLLSA
jgi:hypothetical protein